MPDFDELVAWSEKETEEFRQRVFVGIHPDSYEGAIEVAWEVARQKGAASPANIRVLEHHATGVNPVSDHKVMIALDPRG